MLNIVDLLLYGDAMRLYSKFHDYYDSSIAYGIDEQCHFNRKSEFVDIDPRLDEVKEVFEKSLWWINLDFKFSMLFFCGNIYLRVVYPTAWNKPDLVFWDKESVRQFAEKKIAKGEKSFANFFKKRASWYSDRRSDYDRVCSVFNTIDALNDKNIVDLHFHYDCPYFVIESERVSVEGGRRVRYVSKVLTNPELRDLGFQKHRGSIEAFQEISQFISGVLGGRSPAMVQLEDKDLIKKRGFDNMSFRKAPTKRKKHG